MKSIFCLVVLIFSVSSVDAAAQSELPAQATPHPMREIRVKIVYDQFFAENARKLTAGWAGSHTNLIASAPDDTALAILKHLSRKYENAFGIRLVPALPMTYASLNLPRTDLTDIGYANMLLLTPCESAEIMLGLTGLHLTPAKKDEHFAPPGSDDASGADREHGRMFSGFYADKADPEEIASTVMRLDHELRHLFGADHPEGVREGTEEAKRFMEESIAVVLANRDKPLSCEVPQETFDGNASKK